MGNGVKSGILLGVGGNSQLHIIDEEKKKRRSVGGERESEGGLMCVH